MGIDASKSAKRIQTYVQKKREQFRRLVCEGLERRYLMAADGPRLLSIAPNSGELLSVTRENVLNESPRELVLRFDSDITLASLANGIQIFRSGGDGAFGSAIGGANTIADIREVPAFLNFGESNRIVIARFSQPLADDLYSVQVLGAGSTNPITNTAGQSLLPRIGGTNRDTFTFNLELGTKVLAVVPQPMVRDATTGAISQQRNIVEVYFNDGELYDRAVTSGSPSAPAVVNPDFYKLILTKDTVSPNDDEVFSPSSISYDPVLKKATLTFASPLDQLSASASLSSFRLRIGSNAPVASQANVIVPTRQDLNSDPSGVLSGAFGINGGNAIINGSFSTILSERIFATTGNTLQLDFPGGIDEPGHRDIQDEIHLDGGADSNPNITTIFYSFMDNQSYGLDAVNRPLFSSITPEQRQRVREVFEFYSAQLGVDFVERVGTAQGNEFRIVVGDMAPLGRVSGPGDVIGVAGGGLAIMDGSETWDNSFGFGSNLPNSQSFFQTAMHEIGHLLGLGHTYEQTPDTIMGSTGDLASAGNILEQMFPGNADVIHGQHLFRPDNRDVDLYRFVIPASQSGEVRIETFAERLNNSSNLDTYLTLLKREADGTLSIVGANNNYFSDDSFIRADLGPGEYFISVTGKGNEDNNPNILNSGSGAVSQGSYELRFDFKSTAVAQMTEQKFGSTSQGTALDGDGDGIAGGNFDFWFRTAAPYVGVTPAQFSNVGPARTLIVDKAYQGVSQFGSEINPFTRISQATAAARPGDIIRIVGDNRTPGNLTDDRAYEIGDGGAAIGTLSDGASLDVPKGVTLMIDAGAIFKFGGSGILVGSSDATTDRSNSSIQVLGIPGLPVYMTSYSDQDLGVDTNPIITTPAAGNWGGIEIRNDFDRRQGRFELEREGVFLNTISNAEIKFGGGQIGVGAQARVVSPIDLSEARPLILNNTITRSGDAAISADPNSFEETLFTEPRYQSGGAFIPDYDRVGPDIRSNRIFSNTVNGLFIKIDTLAGGNLETLTVAGRIDESEVTIVLGENLIIEGTPGGAANETIGPDVTLLSFSKSTSANSKFTVPTTATYIVTYIDQFGQESLPSAVRSVSVNVGEVVQLNNLPTATLDYTSRKIYRRDNAAVDGSGNPLYKLVANINKDATQFLDVGSTIPGQIQTLGLTSVSRARRDASLVIDPGTVIKALGGRIEVGMSATLLAEGSPSKPIVFTSRRDDRYGAGGSLDTNNDGTASAGVAGDWAGIVARHLSELSLDNTVVSFGGGASRVPGGFASFNAIEVHQAVARIANSLIESNASGTGTRGTTNRDARGRNEEAAIFVLASQPVIINNVIRNNSEGTGNATSATAAISIDANSLNSKLVRDFGRSTGPNNREPIGIGNYGPLVSNNKLGGNAINGMAVRGATLSTESVWDDTDIVHVLMTEILIPDFHTYGGLRLVSKSDESLVVKLEGSQAGFTAAGRPLDITDRIGGSLQLLGSPGFPVVLTSLADDTIGAGFDFAGGSMLDTNNNGNATLPTAGSWRSVRFEPFSNDRNVDFGYEREPDLLANVGVNDFPNNAESIGSLASSLTGGDENLRLGFTVTGSIASPSDIDVYRFLGVAGTMVWFDVDQTSGTLDSVLEIIDANGQIIALSDNSLNESLAGSVYSNPALIPSGRVFPMDQQAGSPLNSITGTQQDFQGVNPLDAGLRIILPGSIGSVNNYYFRIRSSNVSPVPDAQGQSRSNSARLIDPALVRDGITVGQYKVHVRLQQNQEAAGSTVRYADIRYATTGIDAQGLPIHSPITGDYAETNPTETSNAFVAQALGNLLSTDRGSMSVAGQFEGTDFVDFYRFTARRDNTQVTSTSVAAHVSVIFDLDYADGLGRANTQLWIFDANGRLVMTADDSNIFDDQPGALKGADASDLSRGSMGTRDAYIGPIELPQGDYFVGVSNRSQSHITMRQFSDFDASGFSTVRVEPIDSVTRISEDRFDSSGGFPTTASGPLQVSFSANSAVPFNLSDVVLFTSHGRNIWFNNPLTGVAEAIYSTDGSNAVNFGSGSSFSDLVVTPGGQGVSYQVPTGNITDGNQGSFVSINLGNGGPAVTNSGLVTTTTQTVANSNPIAYEVVQAPNGGVGTVFTALALSPLFASNLSGGGSAASFWGVATRQGGGNQPVIGTVNNAPAATDIGLPVVTSNILYRLSSYNSGAMGTAIDPLGTSLNAAQRGIGAGTNVVAHGFFVKPGPGNNASNSMGVTTVPADGTVTGMAGIGTRLYAVTDAGELMSITPLESQRHVFSDTYLIVRDPDSNAPIQFTSLTAGPRNIRDGGIDYSELLFGVSQQGRLYAFNTSGVLQNIFPGGRSYVQSTDLNGISGIAFSSLDTNLWHVSDLNSGEAGHGRPSPFNNSNDGQTVTNSSLRFGYADPGANVGVQSGSYSGIYNVPALYNTVAGPGGSRGAIESNSIDLREYSADDQPYLYFNYKLNTPDNNNAFGNGQAALDTFRVYGSNESGDWILLATNNAPEVNSNASTIRQDFGAARLSSGSDEFDIRNTGFSSLNVDPFGRARNTTELFDSASWRQARVSLAAFAGLRDVKLRFEFATGGEFRTVSSVAGAIDPTRNGFEFTAVPGDRFVDGGINLASNNPANFVYKGTQYQFDLGLTLNLPSGASIPSGGQLLIGSDTYTFSNNVGTKNIPFTALDTPATLANRVATVLRNNGYLVSVHSSTPNVINVTHLGANRLAPAVSAATYAVAGGLSPAVIIGEPGTGASGAVPVYINNAMTATQVRDAVRLALVGVLNIAGQTTNIETIRVRGNTILLHDSLATTTLTNNSPMLLSDGRIGDVFGALDTDNRLMAASFAAQQNAYNGLQIDDIIIGFAERGETVFNAPNNNSTFAPTPFYEPILTEGSLPANETETGTYQLEIRSAADYGETLRTGRLDLSAGRSFATNDRLSKSFALELNDASQIRDGATFTLSDGANTVRFEFDVVLNANDPAFGVTAGNIAVRIFPNSSSTAIVSAIRDAINSAPAQATLKITATTAGYMNASSLAGFLSPANTIHLNGSVASDALGGLLGFAAGGVPLSIIEYGAETSFGEDLGDSNRLRDQGQFIVSSSVVRNSLNFGINLDGAAQSQTRWSALVGTRPYPGPTRNMVTLNSANVAPGAVIMNNVVYANGAGGINVSGDTTNTNGLPATTIARVVNNTLFGTGGGVGINVNDAASPYLLNNIISNFATGISVSANSISGTVVGGNIYKGNGTNATAGLAQSFQINLGAADPLFNDPANGRFYLAPLSQAIDSSVGSLENRTNLEQVKSAVGLPTSPIIAPSLDVNGLRRSDDPLVNTPAGLGQNVFIDRGAIDRVDFVGPQAKLQIPLDNDSLGLDRDPSSTNLQLQSGTYGFFEILLDESSGTGVDPLTISAESIVLTENGRRLVPGSDFTFGYSVNSRTIRLTPLGGFWRSDSVYEITLVNKSSNRLTVPAGSAITDGQQIRFNVGATPYVFEFDNGNGVSSGAIAIPFATNMSSTAVAGQIMRALATSSFGAVGGRAFALATDSILLSNITGFTSPIANLAIPAIRDMAGNDLLANRANALTQFTILMPEVSVDYADAIQRSGTGSNSATLLVENGARHALYPIDVPTLVLGNYADFDDNGVTSTGANADDYDSSVAFANGLPFSLGDLGPARLQVTGNAASLFDKSVRIIDASGNTVQLLFKDAATTPANTVYPANTIPVLLLSADSANQIAQKLSAAINRFALNLDIFSSTVGSSIEIRSSYNYRFDISNVSGSINRLATGDVVVNVVKAGLADGATMTILDGSGRTVTFQVIDTGLAVVSSVQGSNVPVRVRLTAPTVPEQATQAEIALAFRDAINSAITNRLLNLPQVALVGDSQLKLLMNDDDGVRFRGTFHKDSSPVAVSVVASSAGFLDAWVDWNQDNDFDDVGEKMIASIPVVAGVNTFTFTTPANAVVGYTTARFRLSTSGNLNPSGLAIGGEVEDHLIEVLGGPIPIAIDDPDASTAAKEYRVLEDGTLVVTEADGVLKNDNYIALGTSVYDADPFTTVTEGSVTTNPIDPVVAPLNGKLVFNADGKGGFTYTPNANFFGTDRFVYQTRNDRLVSNRLATVVINVLPVNDAPKGVDDTITINEDNGDTTASPDTFVLLRGTAFTANDIRGRDSNGNPLANETSQNVRVVGARILSGGENGAFVEAAPDRTNVNNEFRFKPGAHLNSSTPTTIIIELTIEDDGVTYQVNSTVAGELANATPTLNTGLPASTRQSTSLLTVVINPLNDRPQFTLDTNNIAELEDPSPAARKFDIVKNVAPGPALAIDETASQTVPNFTVNIVSNHPNPASLFTVAPKITGTGASRSLEYTLAPDVNWANAGGDLLNTDGNGNIILELIAVDDGPSTGTGNLNASLVQRITISVQPVNDAPEFTLPASHTSLEDAGVVTVTGFVTGIRPGTTTAVDETRDQLVTFEVVGWDSNLFVSQPTISADGTLVYQIKPNLNSNYNSPVSNPLVTPAVNPVVQVQLVDNGPTGATNVSRSVIKSFTVVVTPVNDVPVPNVFTKDAVEDVVLRVQASEVLNGDLVGPIDENLVEGQVNRITRVDATTAMGGTVTVFLDGTTDRITHFDYAPPANYFGLDTFTYTATDSGNPQLSAIGTITLDVKPVNDPPTFTSGGDVVVLEDSAAFSQAWATNITAGPSNEVQTVTFVVTSENPTAFPNFFAVAPAVSETGVLTFTLAQDATGSAVISIYAQDSGPSGGVNNDINRSAVQTFTITASPVNDVPVFSLSSTLISHAEDPSPALQTRSIVTTVAPARSTAVDELLGQTVSFEVTTNVPASYFTVAPRVVGTGANRSLEYQLAPDINRLIVGGDILISLVAVDSGPSTTPPANVNRSAAQVVTLRISEVNDPPQFDLAFPTLTIDEDAPLQLLTSFYTNELAGPATALDELAGSPTAQTVTRVVTVPTEAIPLYAVLPRLNASGDLEFQLKQDVNRNFAALLNRPDLLTITITATDNGKENGVDQFRSTSKVVTLVVNPINDAPTFTATTNRVEVNEDANAVSIANFLTNVRPAGNLENGVITAIDEAGQVLSFTMTVSNPSLFSDAPKIDANGRLTFTSAKDKNGQAIITARLFDNGASSPAPNTNVGPIVTFTIVVNAINDAPEFTIPTELTVIEDQGVVSLPGFATGIRPGPETADDENRQILTFQATEFDTRLFEVAPTMQSDGTLSFKTRQDVNSNTANIDFVVKFQLSDNGASSPAPNTNRSTIQSFTLKITPVNDPPIPNGFTASGTEDTVTTVDASDVLLGDAPGPEDEFAAGQTVRITQVELTSERGGTVRPTFTNGELVSFEYIPPANLVGNDFVRYVVADNGVPSRSATGTITISIGAVNDAPQFTAGPDITLLEDAPAYSQPWATDILAGPINAPDEWSGPNAQNVSFLLTPSSTSFFEVQPTIDASGVLSFKLAKDVNGSVTVDIRAQDDGPTGGNNRNTSLTHRLTITVGALNDAPGFVLGANVTVDEDSGAFSAPFVTKIVGAEGMNSTPATGSDESGQTVTFTVTNSNNSLFSTQPSIDSTGRLTFTPAADASGVVVVSVVGVDNGPSTAPNVNTSAAKSFTITLTPKNDAPFAVNDRYTTSEDAVLNIAAPGVLENDRDVDLPNDTLKVVVPTTTITTSLGAVVTLNANGSFSYDPRSAVRLQQLTTDQVIVDTFTYTIIDSTNLTSNLATVSITVTGVNDAPVAVNDTFQVATDIVTSLNVLQNDTDIDSSVDVRTVEIGALPTHGTVTVLATGRIDYRPNANYAGSDSFTYRFRDSQGLLSNEATVTLNVSQLPVATDDSFVVVKNVVSKINVLQNDFDPDPSGGISATSVTIATNPDVGTARVLATGEIEYTPPTDFIGTATLRYFVTDLSGQPSNIATVTLRVVSSLYQNPVNRLDVNNDTFISPIDVLLIVNDINRNGSRTLPPGLAVPPYIDVNGDGELNPLDALAVVNFINSVGNAGGSSGNLVSGGEGESSSTLALWAPVDVEALSNTRYRELLKDRQNQLEAELLNESLTDHEWLEMVYGPIEDMQRNDEEHDWLSISIAEEDGSQDAVDDLFSNGLWS